MNTFQHALRQTIVFRAMRKMYSLAEQSRPFRCRQEIWKYRFPAGGERGRVLLIVTAGHYLTDASWAAASLLSASAVLNSSMQLVFCVDGPDESGDLIHARSSFPNARFETTDQILKGLEQEFPRLTRFARAHPMGRKLAALFFFTQRYDLLYSDSDVLAFQQPTELEEALIRTKPVYLPSSLPGHDPGTIEKIRQIGLPLPPAVNSGFLYMPKGGMDPGLIEQLVPDPDEMDNGSPTWWWIEQTIVAALLGEIAAAPLPEARYSVSLQRQWPFEHDLDYGSICLRHFVSPVRHLMYARGIPYLLRKNRNRWQEYRLPS